MKRLELLEKGQRNYGDEAYVELFVDGQFEGQMNISGTALNELRDLILARNQAISSDAPLTQEGLNFIAVSTSGGVAVIEVTAAFNNDDDFDCKCKGLTVCHCQNDW